MPRLVLKKQYQPLLLEMVVLPKGKGHESLWLSPHERGKEGEEAEHLDADGPGLAYPGLTTAKSWRVFEPQAAEG